MKHSHKEQLLLFLVSSTLAVPWDWEFLISPKRHPKKADILTIPRHIFTESREVFVWTQVRKPSDSSSDASKYDTDNDCLPTTIAQETEEIGSVNFKASHPNLPNGTQTFEVAINQTSMVKRVLCLSHFTQDSEKAISFEATVNKPVCRDIKVMLELGGDDCHNTLEYDSAEIQSNHSEASHEIKCDECDNTPAYDTAIIKSNHSEASSEIKADYTKLNILYSSIGILALMFVVRCGWKPISAMFKKMPSNVGDVESEGSESLRSLESKINDDNVPNSMGAQKRGESRNKNEMDKIESEESESLRTVESKPIDDNVPKSMGAKKGGKSRSKNKID